MAGKLQERLAGGATFAKSIARTLCFAILRSHVVMPMQAGPG
jgi:hypothetical protein